MIKHRYTLRVYGEEGFPLGLEGKRINEVIMFLASRAPLCGMDSSNNSGGIRIGPAKIDNIETQVVEISYLGERASEGLCRLALTVQSEYDLRCKAKVYNSSWEEVKYDRTVG